MLRFIPFHDVRRDFGLGELAHAHLHLLLLFAQLKVHSEVPFSTRYKDSSSGSTRFKDWHSKPETRSISNLLYLNDSFHREPRCLFRRAPKPPFAGPA